MPLAAPLAGAVVHTVSFVMITKNNPRDIKLPQISKVQKLRFTVTRAINNAKYGFDGTNKPFVLSPFEPSRQTQIDEKVSKVMGGVHFVRSNTILALLRKAKNELLSRSQLPPP